MGQPVPPMQPMSLDTNLVRHMCRRHWVEWGNPEEGRWLLERIARQISLLDQAALEMTKRLLLRQKPCCYLGDEVMNGIWYELARLRSKPEVVMSMDGSMVVIPRL